MYPGHRDKTLGGHEMNAGCKVLEKFRQQSPLKWILLMQKRYLILEIFRSLLFLQSGAMAFGAILQPTT